MSNILKYTTFVVMVLGIKVALSQPVTYPSSFTVAADGSGNFRTIQEAKQYTVENVLGDWVKKYE